MFPAGVTRACIWKYFIIWNYFFVVFELLVFVVCKPTTAGKYVNVLTKAQFQRRASAVPNLIVIRFDCSTAETVMKQKQWRRFRNLETVRAYI